VAFVVPERCERPAAVQHGQRTPRTLAERSSARARYPTSRRAQRGGPLLRISSCVVSVRRSSPGTPNNPLVVMTEP